MINKRTLTGGDCLLPMPVCSIMLPCGRRLRSDFYVSLNSKTVDSINKESYQLNIACTIEEVAKLKKFAEDVVKSNDVKFLHVYKYPDSILKVISYNIRVFEFNCRVSYPNIVIPNVVDLIVTRKGIIMEEYYYENAA